jgi:hypothetical protein
MASQPSKAVEEYGYEMMEKTKTMRVEAQQTLVELYVAGLLPFKLVAHVVESLGMEEYIVRFNDSRLFSLDLSLPSNQDFKTVFRAAVLSRVARLKTNFRSAQSA